MRLTAPHWDTQQMMVFLYNLPIIPIGMNHANGRAPGWKFGVRSNHGIQKSLNLVRHLTAFQLQ